MKRLRTFALISIATFASSVALAQNQIPPAVRAYYDKENALTLKVDFDSLKKLRAEISTKDYVYVSKPNKAGVVTKKSRSEEDAQMDQLKSLIQSITKSTNHFDQVTLSNSTLVLVITSTGELKTKPMGGDGKAHLISNTAKSEDTWVKVGGTWKMKSSKSISDRMTFDGKAAPGM